MQKQKIISFAKNRVLEGHCAFDPAFSSITGWVRDCDAPNKILALTRKMNNKDYQTIEANQRSDQLERHDPSNSYHGFNLDLPRERPKAIKVSIFECESGLKCPGSPVQISASIT